MIGNTVTLPKVSISWFRIATQFRNSHTELLSSGIGQNFGNSWNQHRLSLYDVRTCLWLLIGSLFSSMWGFGPLHHGPLPHTHTQTATITNNNKTKTVISTQRETTTQKQNCKFQSKAALLFPYHCKSREERGWGERKEKANQCYCSDRDLPNPPISIRNLPIQASTRR